MLNLSTRIGTGTKVTVNNTFNRSADNEATVLRGHDEEFDTDLERTRLTFIERSVRSNQLAAEHLIGARHFLDWSVTSSGVTRDEPDRSDLAYTLTNGRPDLWFGAPRSANRTFSTLDETGWNLAGNYRLLLGPVANPATLKVGGAWRSTTRDADSRSYDIINATRARPSGRLRRRGSSTVGTRSRAGSSCRRTPTPAATALTRPSVPGTARSSCHSRGDSG